MSKEERIKETKEEIRFIKWQLRELLLESGVLTEIKKLAIDINLKRLDELEKELANLLNQ